MVLKAKVNNNRLLKPLIFIILILPLFSCTPKKEVSDIESQNTAAILERVSLFENAIKSLKGLAKVKIKTPDSKISYTQVTIAKRPDLLRLEALNPFGKTVGFISSDGNNIYIISQSERAIYDSNTEFNLAYVYPGLNLKITANNLVNLILGRLPENTYDMKSSPKVSAEGGLIKLTFASSNSNSPDYLWVNSQNFRVERAEFSLVQGTRAKVEYEYFDNLIEGFYFPQTIDFTSEGLSISIFYEEDLELNEEVNRKLFTPPDKTTKVEK